MKRLFLTIFFFIITSAPLQDILFAASPKNKTATKSEQSRKLTFISGPKQVSLVELYSSEGCSSCPPADRWISGLGQNRGLWKDFIPIVFHVDYWDRLGWIDRLARKSFTNRQRQYARQWNQNRIYTPCVIHQGQEWKQWVGKTPKSEKTRVGHLKVTTKNKRDFKVSFQPISSVIRQISSERQTEKNTNTLQINGALLGQGLKTKVLAGENKGSTLRHDFVVLDLKQVPLEKKKGVYQAQITLSKKQKVNPKFYNVVFWVNQINLLDPIQATGGPL